MALNTLTVSDNTIIGSGSYGQVFKTGNNPYVTKQIPRDRMCSAIRELLVFAIANHSNVLAVESFTFTQHYIRLQLPMFDMDLEKWIHVDKNKYVNFENTMSIVCQISNGLEHLHSMNIIHADLKPKNILIKNASQVCICDFGIVKIHGVVCRSAIQTADYRAPEVFITKYSSKPVKSMDIWSLGMIIVALFKPVGGSRRIIAHDDAEDGTIYACRLLGVTYHKKESKQIERANRLRSLMKYDFDTRLAKLCPAIEPHVVMIVRHCLQVEPQQRATIRQVKNLLNISSDDRAKKKIYADYIHDLTIRTHGYILHMDMCYLTHIRKACITLLSGYYHILGEMFSNDYEFTPQSIYADITLGITPPTVYTETIDEIDILTTRIIIVFNLLAYKQLFEQLSMDVDYLKTTDDLIIATCCLIVADMLSYEGKFEYIDMESIHECEEYIVKTIPLDQMLHTVTVQ